MCPKCRSERVQFKPARRSAFRGTWVCMQCWHRWTASGDETWSGAAAKETKDG